MKFVWAVCAVMFGLASGWTARAQGFSTVAPMNVARSLHTATLLQSGKVLVAGGEMDGGSELTSAEIYDPAANTWTLAAPLNTARKRHAATLLSDGTVLVTGGLGVSGSLASVEIYDPVANTWTNTTSMSSPRQDHTATVLPNGKVLVAGGDKQAGSPAITPLNSAEFYDPASNGWTSTPNMAKAHFYNASILLQNNDALIVSGDLTLSGTTATTSNTGELYDYIANTWGAGGTLTTGRAQFILAAVAYPKILVAGGINGTNRLASAELYDQQMNTWSVTGSMITARNLHTGTPLNSGQVFVAGGFDGSNPLSSAETYDPVAGQWSSAGSLAFARQSHTATLLQNGTVLLAGGINQIELSSVEVYDPGNTGPLTLTSAPSASPNPATAGTSVVFGVSASGGMGVLTYTWSFGDGGSATGASVSHTYAAAGTYTATVTIVDASGNIVSGSTNVVVNASGGIHTVIVGIGADNDADGFSNVVEETFGSDPNNANSVPLGVTNVLAPLPLVVNRLHVYLNYRRATHDMISLSGTIPIPAGFTPSGAKIGIDIAGVPYLATLNANGRSGTVFALKIRSTGGRVPAQSAPFTLNLIDGTFAPALSFSGLTQGDFVKVHRTVTVSVLFNTKLYQVHQPQLWSCRLYHYGTSR